MKYNNKQGLQTCLTGVGLLQNIIHYIPKEKKVVLSLQDDVLIKRLLEGEQEAFAFMIDKYSKLLWLVVGGVIGNIGTKEDIEECISDVYVQVWKNPRAFNNQKGTLKTYLAIIAKSKALDKYRKLSKLKVIEIDEAITAPDDDLLDYIVEKEKSKALYSVLETLKEPDKEILIRRYFFDEKPSRIAEKISIPVKEVENRLYKSKLKLRKILSSREV